MWWLSQQGRISGPFSEAELRRRIELNLVRSLDRVSQDQSTWQFARQTALWQQLQAPPPPPKPTLASRRSAAAPLPAVEEVRLPRPHPPAPGVPSVIPPTVEPRRPKPRHWGVWGAIAGAAALVVVAGGVLLTWARRPAEARQVQFRDVKEAMAIITTDSGQGSGFLVTLEGDTYLVTNEHVIRSTQPPKACLLDGTTLSLGRLELAEDRDLVRFAVAPRKRGSLRLAATLPDTGEAVVLYGNSLGGGVVTESRGKLLGVGPVRLETDAEIVNGNSGGPLLSERGEVLGVASFVEKRDETWVTRETRYTATRRFALRLNGTSWKSLDPAIYHQEVERVKAIDHCFAALFPHIQVARANYREEPPSFGDYARRNFKQEGLGFEEPMAEIAALCEQLYEARESVLKRLDNRGKALDFFTQQGLSLDEWNQAVATFDEQTRQQIRDFFAIRRQYLLKGIETARFLKTLLNRQTWQVPQIARGNLAQAEPGSVAWFNEVLEEWLAQLGSALVDLNKVSETLN